MKIPSFVRQQLRSVIEWDTADPGDLFEKWSGNGDEIKNASKLLVKPGQGAIFVYEGKIEGVHTEEGLFNLKTDNIPFVTTITKFMQSFVSEHKVGIYFFWRTEQVNQKWGTASPIKYLDPVYKIPVSLRAYGNFSLRILDPKLFFSNIVGTRETFSVNELRQVLSARIVQPLTDVFATAGRGVTEVDSYRVELSEKVSQVVSNDFNVLGLTLTDFRIEGSEFDEGTMGRINAMADIIVEGQAAQAVGVDYAQLQQLRALRDAAKNPGGAAGAGIGLGAGVAMGQQFMNQMSSSGNTTQAASSSPALRLKNLKDLFDGGVLSKEEFEAKKKELMALL